MRSTSTALLVLTGILILGSRLGAQTTTGNLDGRVTDDSGAVLPGVSVTVSSPSLMGLKTTVTSDNGSYRVAAIPPGTYSAKYELAGFQTVVREGLQVELAATTTVDVQLALSTLQESVTVTGESPTVDVRNTNVTSTFTTQLLENLPSSRQLLGVLAQTPGVQSGVVEVGASNLAAYTAPRTYGIAGRQQFSLDGVDITEGSGHVGTYPDYTSWEQVAISTSGHTAEARYPGMLTNSVIKSGGNSFHGTVFGTFQNDSFESDNSSPELVERGLRRGTRLDKYWEGAGDIGGPVIRDTVWFYTGARRQKHHSFPAGYFQPGSEDPVSTFIQLDSFTFKGTYRLSDANSFSSFVQRTKKWVPNNFAGAGTPPESTVNWFVYGTPWKVAWTSILSDRQFLEAGLYVHVQDWNTFANSDGPRRSDSTSGWRSGGWSNPGNVDFGNYRRQGSRPQFRVNLHNQLERHDMKLGFEYVPYVETVTQKGSPGEVTHIFRGGTTPVGIPITSAQLAGRFGTPSEVLVENTPVTFKDGVVTISAFAHDTWTVGERLTMNLGMRLDHTEAYFPDQDNPQRLWAGAESFGALRDVITWTSVAPRIGLAYSLTADKRTVVKLNFGQYYEMPDPRAFDLANQNGWKKAAYIWNDRNGNGVLVNAGGAIDPDEIDLTSPIRTEGGSTTTIDPDLKHPRMDELSVAFERELLADFSVSVDYNYRRLVDNIGLVNEFQTPDQFSIPATVVDPGPDGRYGSPDDRPFTAYNLNPALVGGRFVRNVLTTPPGFDQSYHNVTFSADRRLRDNWQVRASVTVTTIDEVVRGGGIGFDNRLTHNNWPRNPNEALNDRTDWLTWNGRILGSYSVPRFDLQVSGVLRMQAGDQFARRFVSRPGELNYGTQWFWAEPQNTNRLDNVYIADVRAEKSFKLGGSRRVSAMIDCFNLLNSAAIRAVNNTSGASYLRVSSVVNPRVFMAGARLTF